MSFDELCVNSVASHAKRKRLDSDFFSGKKPREDEVEVDASANVYDEPINIADEEGAENEEKDPRDPKEILYEKVLSTVETFEGWLDDEAIDAIARDFIRVEDVAALAYVSSLNVEIALTHEIDGLYEDLDAEPKRLKIIKDLGLSSDFDATKVKVVLIPLHGPETQHNILDRMRSDEKAGARHASPRNNHWSLLAWFKEFGTFCHYDSKTGMNDERGKEIASFFLDNLIIPGQQAKMQRPSGIPPRQKNSWDCGYQVLLMIYMFVWQGKYPKPLQERDFRQVHHELVRTIHRPNGLLRIEIIKHFTQKLNEFCY